MVVRRLFGALVCIAMATTAPAQVPPKPATAAGAAHKPAVAGATTSRVPIGGVTHIAVPAPTPGPPPPPQLQLYPSLIDSSLGRADTLLRRLEVQVAHEELTVNVGVESTVVRQSPPAGSPISRPALVTLVWRHIIPAPAPASPPNPPLKPQTKSSPPPKSPPPSRPIAPWIVAGVLLLLGAAHLAGAFGPQFRTTMARQPTRLDTPASPAGVQHDLTIVTSVERAAPTLDVARESIVLREGRHHEG